MARFAICLALALLPSCIDVPRRPLDAGAELALLQARSLTSPEVAQSVAPRLGLAPESWPPPTLDLAALYAVALQLRPEMAAARVDVQAALAGVTTAGTGPNPSVSVMPETITHTDVSPMWALSVALEFVLWPAERLERQVALAEQQVALAALSAGEQAWSLYTEVRDALQEHLLAREDYDLALLERSLRERTVAAQRALVEGGLSTGPELRREEVEARIQSVEPLLLEGRVAATRQRLAAAMGIAAEQLAAYDLEAPALAHEPDAAEQQTWLLDRLDLRRTLAEYEAAERALELELARQWPDVRLGPGFQYDQGEHRFQLLASSELPLVDKHEGPIAEAVARREQVAARFRVEQGRALAQIEAARVTLRAVRATVRALDESLSGQAARAEAAERAVQAGGLDRLTALHQRFDLLVARRAVQIGQAGLALAAAQLEDALQRPLDPHLLSLARVPVDTSGKPVADASSPGASRDPGDESDLPPDDPQTERTP